MAAATAATVCTAGAASPLLLASFTAGAATFKLGANAYMTGENFDSRSSNVLAKLSSGAVNGFTGIFGPAEMTMLLGMGTKAATKVSGQVLVIAPLIPYQQQQKKKFKKQSLPQLPTH